MSLALGSPAPQFELPGVDGEAHSLERYADAELLVLVEFCNHCPYAIAWQGRIAAIASEYADRGVAVVAVSSNDADTFPEDSFPKMKERAEQLGFPFAYVYDEPQSLARELQAERTPEVFVFDRERRLRYHGAVDDNRDERAVETQYLRDALDALLAGEEPPVAETAPVGCSVKWRPE